MTIFWSKIHRYYRTQILNKWQIEKLETNQQDIGRGLMKLKKERASVKLHEVGIFPECTLFQLQKLKRCLAQIRLSINTIL